MHDFILNGQAHGPVANRLLAAGCDPNVLRPWIGADGRSYMTVNQKGKPVVVPTNNTATLLYDEWKFFDNVVQQVTQTRRQAWADLRATSPYTIPNGMGVPVLSRQMMSNINPATTSMSPRKAAEQDRPVSDISYLPLPITFKDFSFDIREIEISRRGLMPLDSSMVSLATEQVDEAIEKLVLGVSGSFSYGGGTLYGYTNFPGRITYTITSPLAGGWTPSTLIRQILAMKRLAADHKRYGPWMVYVAPNWDLYLDDDYSAAKGDNSLRERVMKVNGIRGVSTSEFLTNYDIVMVQMTPSNARAVLGMETMLVQWDTEGGFLSNFKVLTIKAVDLRADYESNTGLIHAAA